jgi:hypothetical protein
MGFHIAVDLGALLDQVFSERSFSDRTALEQLDEGFRHAENSLALVGGSYNFPSARFCVTPKI